MTTKELEKKLKISNDTCIHCPTLELAKQVLSIFNQLGLRWSSEMSYTFIHNWDNFKEDTVYYPFKGECSALVYAHAIGYKVISAEEFITLHTEEKEFNLENYEPKGDLIGFPKEIIAKMLDYQEEQCNLRDVGVFEEMICARMNVKGFTWDKTKEGWWFWSKVIRNKNFDIFFEMYPKKEEIKVCSKCKESRKIPLSLDSVETDIDTLIGILQQLKQDKDYNDIRVFNIDKLKFLEFNINEDEDDEAFFKIINDIEGQVIREIEPSTQKYKYSCYLRNNSCARSICLGVDLDMYQLINILITLTH